MDRRGALMLTLSRGDNFRAGRFSDRSKCFAVWSLLALCRRQGVFPTLLTAPVVVIGGGLGEDRTVFAYCLSARNKRSV